MEYLKLAPDIDTNPEIMRAGWWGARFYELLLKVSALKDLKGRVPPDYQDLEWLARMWNLGPDDFGAAVTVAAIMARSKDSAQRAGLFTVDGGDWVLRGWEKYYRPAKPGAIRQAEYEKRQREKRASGLTAADGPDETDATSPTPPTPLHPPTPQEEAKAPAPFAGEAVAATVVPPTKPPDAWSEVDFWAWAQSIREKGGLYAEDPPRKREALSRWWSQALMSDGITPAVLKETFYNFGRSEHWGGVETPYPFAAFMSEWRKFLPPRRTHAAAS